MEPAVLFRDGRKLGKVHLSIVPTLIAQYGLLMVAGIIFAGELGLPTLVPGEVALLIAGSQFIHSVPALIGSIFLFGAVDIVATTTIHAGSRTGGNRLLRRLLCCLVDDSHKSENVIARWRGSLGGRDAAVVFVTRLIPMFRLYASVTTGLIRIRFRDFAIGAWPAALVWATTPLTLGFLLRSRIGSLEGQYPVMMRDVIIGSVAFTLLLFVGGWTSRGETRAGVLLRLRLVVAAAAFLAAWGRLVSLAVWGVGQISHVSIVPTLPAVPVRVGIITLAALGVLAIASRDLQAIRSRHHAVRMLGPASSATFVCLTTAIGLVIVPN